MNLPKRVNPIRDAIVNVTITPKAAINKRLHAAINKLDDMVTWPKDWDGHNSKKPNKLAIENAKRFIKVLNNHPNWLMPSISADSNGEVVLEWSEETRDLSIYVSSNKIIFIKVPSADINTMEDGEIEELNSTIYESLFGWLRNGTNSSAN